MNSEYVSLFDNIATANLSYDVKTGRYMAEGLFRHYVLDKLSTDVLAVNVLFIDVNRKPAFQVPLFVVARISYVATTGNNSERQSRFWHPWAALVDWNGGDAMKCAVTILEPKKDASVQSVKLRAVPLFSISGIEKAMSVIREVLPESTTAPIE